MKKEVPALLALVHEMNYNFEEEDSEKGSELL